MASAARRARGAARRPLAMLASPSPSRNGRAVKSAENVAAPEGVPFAQRVRRFRKCNAAKKCGVVAGLLSPVSVSKKPAATASRRRAGSVSKRRSTPTTAKARDRPRAPLWDLSEDRGGTVRANLSTPFDEAASRNWTTRSVAMEEAMAGLPEPGEGRVKYLVDTFERLLLLAGGGPEARSCGATKSSSSRRRRKSEAMATARTSSASSRTPPPPAAEEIDVSYPSSEVSFPAIAGVACILDASDRTSMIRATREQRRLRRCNSTDSPQRTCSRKVTSVTTSQRPFNLRTEQRGKAKEVNFVQRMRKMQLEEETMRNPLAQGLPFTTDEPECPAKPAIKDPTEPIDLVLHSDVRAAGRAEFDHQVAERASFMEEVKSARERQRKVDEEVEIRQLRKEQVPRAHPMPDFTKPFVPKRSVKPHTIPREPRFHPRLGRNTAKA